MFPYVNIFGKQISSYAIMAAVGAITAGAVACRSARKKGLDDYNILMMLLIVVVGIMIGGHVMYGITNMNKLVMFIKHLGNTPNMKTFFVALGDIFGGSVFYGGLIGGMLFGYIYLKKKKLPVGECIDIVTPVIPLFHFFGRIGCFLVGCCYGIESKLGFTYDHSLVESANHVNRFPIQLVEASYNLLLFFLLYYLYRKNKMRHKLLGLYLLLYPIGRFIFEFFRGDEYRGFLFGLSTSQIISIILFIFSIYIIYIKKDEAKKV